MSTLIIGAAGMIGQKLATARLNPTFDTLPKAREYAWRAGDMQPANLSGEHLLSWAKPNGSQAQLAAAVNEDARNEHALNLNAPGRLPEAKALYAKALPIARDKPGDNHPTSQTCARNDLTRLPRHPRPPALSGPIAPAIHG